MKEMAPKLRNKQCRSWGGGKADLLVLALLLAPGLAGMVPLVVLPVRHDSADSPWGWIPDIIVIAIICRGGVWGERDGSDNTEEVKIGIGSGGKKEETHLRRGGWELIYVL